MTRTISVTFRDVRNGNREHVVTQEELDAFAREHVSDDGLRARISYLMLAELMLMADIAGTAPGEVLQAIHQLENGDGTPGTKKAAQFRHAPLKGLWHKHYFCARFYTNNLAIGWSGDRLERMLRDELPKNEGELITREMIASIARRFAEEPYLQRYEKQKLTGEWIVFLRCLEKNYYLCLATHTSQTEDQRVFFKAQAAAIHHGPDWAARFSEAIGQVNLE